MHGCPASVPLAVCLILLRPPRSPLFPYTTLFRSVLVDLSPDRRQRRGKGDQPGELGIVAATPVARVVAVLLAPPRVATRRDRKSTRLNSSHRCISYAVFCLKKKKKERESDETA